MLNETIVSFVIIARDAEQYLPGILADVELQDYPEEAYEILLVNSGSRDSTAAIMAQFKRTHPHLKIFLCENKKGILASGWNVALAQSQGRILLRVDAHSRINADFIRRNVSSVLRYNCIVGGGRITRLPELRGHRLLALAEMSKFGSGIAFYRHAGEKGRYVDTLAHAAYPREVFKTVGGYDERLVRTEDNEIHYRIKKAGYAFYYDPGIVSFHHARSTFREIMWQKYLNGEWIGLTLGIQPRCFAFRHFVPLLFLAGLVAAVTAVAVGMRWYLPEAFVAVYCSAALFFTASAAVSRPAKGIRIHSMLMPFIFFSMHMAYGAGTLVGILRMPLFVWNNRRYKIPFPIK